MRWLPSRIATIFACFIWLVSIGVGQALLTRYSARPGAAALPQSVWPGGSTLVRPARGDFLLLFVHPQCPCSNATIDNLENLLAACPDNLTATVVFVKPRGTSPGWEKSALWQSASRIPNVKVICDDGGTEAARFDASTSGQTFLYSSAGRLLFRGGITTARGHAGDNAGSDAIIALEHGTPPLANHTSVFGCPLFDPNAQREAICRQ